jgi:hypothetical protein
MIPNSTVRWIRCAWDTPTLAGQPPAVIHSKLDRQRRLFRSFHRQGVERPLLIFNRKWQQVRKVSGHLRVVQPILELREIGSFSSPEADAVAFNHALPLPCASRRDIGNDSLISRSTASPGETCLRATCRMISL